jgi:hypothetical protein
VARPSRCCGRGITDSMRTRRRQSPSARSSGPRFPWRITSPDLNQRLLEESRFHGGTSMLPPDVNPTRTPPRATSFGRGLFRVFGSFVNNSQNPIAGLSMRPTKTYKKEKRDQGAASIFRLRVWCSESQDFVYTHQPPNCQVGFQISLI